MSDVFLSYANADRDKARALAEVLSRRGYSVWWDRTIPPGRVFDEVIQEALSAAGCVVVLWSRTSATSNWVKTEAAEGASRRVLVPAVIDDVPIPIEFRRIQAANLQGWTGDSDHPELESLMQSVERLSRGAGREAPLRLDRSAPGGLVRPERRITIRAAVGLALVAAAIVTGFFLAARALWPGRDTPVSTAALGAVPKMSFEDVPAPEILTSWTDTEAVLTTNKSDTIVITAGTLSNCLTGVHTLTLGNGQEIDFERMKSLEVLHADPLTAKLLITLLNGKTMQGNMAAGCEIFGYTDVGRFATSFQKLKRIDFRR